jgi:hypothetical protein
MRKGGKKGCQCKDGTYTKECCDGQSQGIGSTEQHTISNVTQTNVVRQITTTNG